MKAYWWKAKDGGSNFGDEITPIVMAGLFGTHCDNAAIEDADLVSVGSILNKLINNKGVLKKSGKIHVVGSGLISPKIKYSSMLKRLRTPKRVFHDKVVIHSVRGYLTQQALAAQGEPEYPVGDPGLLLPAIYNPMVEKRFKVGFIPHISTIDQPFWSNAHEGKSGFTTIDLRTDDIEEVVTQIKSCDVVISQSLHGLVIADAYGVPNYWFYDHPLHAGGKFKFYDYFSTVGRDFNESIDSLDSASLEKAITGAVTVPRHKIGALEASIIESFKSALSQIK